MSFCLDIRLTFVGRGRLPVLGWLGLFVLSRLRLNRILVVLLLLLLVGLLDVGNLLLVGIVAYVLWPEQAASDYADRVIAGAAAPSRKESEEHFCPDGEWRYYRLPMGMCRSYKIGENAMMYNMYNALTAAGPASSSEGEEEAVKTEKAFGLFELIIADAAAAAARREAREKLSLTHI